MQVLTYTNKLVVAFISFIGQPPLLEGNNGWIGYGINEGVGGYW